MLVRDRLRIIIPPSVEERRKASNRPARRLRDVRHNPQSWRCYATSGTNMTLLYLSLDPSLPNPNLSLKNGFQWVASPDTVESRNEEKERWLCAKVRKICRLRNCAWLFDTLVNIFTGYSCSEMLDVPCYDRLIVYNDAPSSSPLLQLRRSEKMEEAISEGGFASFRHLQASMIS